MTFHKKLDLLMKIASTTNSKLARFVSLDPSFVSRLRRGIRRPAKNENYIKPIAFFLAKQISEEHQKKALSKALNIPLSEIPRNLEAFSELIYKWFFDQSLQNLTTVQGFLDTLVRPGSTFPDFTQPSEKSNVSINERPPSKIDALVFYGLEGKQGAALEFLALVAANPNPQTLLLFSDEDLEWLTSNREFIARWSQLLIQIASQGNKVKIVHTVSRDLPEMLSAIKQWLPVYMTGAIEPYHYPKKRDGVLQRTLFIAPDTAAVVSGSVRKKIQNTATFLFKDRKTILALADEFYNFFSLCRPLMKIFTRSKTPEFFETLWEFEGEDANTFITTDTLSIITMPDKVLSSILARTKHHAKKSILSKQKLRIKRFENSLQNYTFLEAIDLPALEDVRLGKVKIAFPCIPGDTEFCYTLEEYCSHLENLIRLLKKYANYHVTFRSNDVAAGFMLYIKEDIGVLVANSSPPTVIFAIHESNIVAAFWDYIEPPIHDYKASPSDKAATIAKLGKFVTELRSG